MPFPDRPFLLVSHFPPRAPSCHCPYSFGCELHFDGAVVVVHVAVVFVVVVVAVVFVFVFAVAVLGPSVAMLIRPPTRQETRRRTTVSVERISNQPNEYHLCDLTRGSAERHDE